MGWFTQLLRKRSTNPRHEVPVAAGEARRRQEPRLPAAEQLLVTPVVPAGPRRR